MEFVISREDLESALEQILQDQASSSAVLVDLTVDPDCLHVVITGRHIDVPIQVHSTGSVSVPASVLLGVQRALGSFPQDAFLVRISPGRIRINSSSISHEGIVLRRVARRIIDLPADASDLDILALPLLFSQEEIDDSALSARLLDTQHRLSTNLETAAASLHPYRVSVQDLQELALGRIRSYAAGLDKSLLVQQIDETDD